MLNKLAALTFLSLVLFAAAACAGEPNPNEAVIFDFQKGDNNRFEGADRFLPATLGLCLEAPGYTVTDLDDLLAGEVFSADHLVAHTTTMKDFGLKFSVPMFFVEGTEDFTTPTQLARRYMDALEAPRKAFVPIEGGHFAVFIHSDEFLKQLLVHVSALATSPVR